MGELKTDTFCICLHWLFGPWAGKGIISDNKTEVNLDSSLSPSLHVEA